MRGAIIKLATVLSLFLISCQEPSVPNSAAKAAQVGSVEVMSKRRDFANGRYEGKQMYFCDLDGNPKTVEQYSLINEYNFPGARPPFVLVKNLVRPGYPLDPPCDDMPAAESIRRHMTSEEVKRVDSERDKYSLYDLKRR